MIARKVDFKKLHNQLKVVKAKLDDFRGKTFEFEMLARPMIGWQASFVMEQLKYMPGKHAFALNKLIKSGIANGVNNEKMSPDSIYIKTISVSRGKYLKRIEFKGRGRTGRIWKPSANVLLELQEVELGK